MSGSPDRQPDPSIGSGGMSGVEIAQRLEAQLWSMVPALGCERSQEDPEVVAGVDPLHHLAGEPSRAFGEHRCAAIGPGLPPATRELVNLVAGLFTEESGQFDVGRAEGMDDQQVGAS